VPKNYENWLAVDKVIAKIIRLTFLAHPVVALFNRRTPSVGLATLVFTVATELIDYIVEIVPI